MQTFNDLNQVNINYESLYFFFFSFLFNSNRILRKMEMDVFEEKKFEKKLEKNHCFLFCANVSVSESDIWFNVKLNGLMCNSYQSIVSYEFRKNSLYRQCVCFSLAHITIVTAYYNWNMYRIALNEC